MTTDDSNHQRLEAALDRLIDAAPQNRDGIIEELSEGDPVFARRIKMLLHYALGETHVEDTVDAAAPDLVNAMYNGAVIDKIGAKVGAYKIIDYIGRGGMGDVFLAERADGVYDQTVAVKFLSTDLLHDRNQAMFDRERRRLARLEHPNIARIIDAGSGSDGASFFIMEFVDGAPFDKCAKALSRNKRLELILQLCDAVAYCHRSFVIHGDLKPGNILVADGRVRLLDFGIGRLADEAADPGRETLYAYSQRYAAPERLEGNESNVLTDVYSLGVLLRDILVENRKASETDKHHDSATKKTVSPDLEAIMARAAASSSKSRYPSVEAMARDIRAYLNDYPVDARKPTKAYRAKKFIARNRSLVTATGFVIVSLSVGLAAALWQYGEARREALRAQEASAFVASLFDRAHPDVAGEQNVTLRQIMDEAADRLAVELEIRLTFAMTSNNL